MPPCGFTSAMIQISDNDIVTTTADVVVNSANPPLGGIGPDLPEGVGGVDGAIHRAAGISLWHHLQQLPVLGELEPGWPVRCWPGHCVVTPGFGMSVRYIVHGVAPIFEPNNPTKCFTVLAELYKNIFEAIAVLDVKTVAVPPIGTRSYGFPMREAAEIAVVVSQRFVEATGDTVEFFVIDKEEHTIYCNLLRRDSAPGQPGTS